MSWTNKQKEAIDSREGNFLVSAGAGSGKTAVLTQRITDIIASGQAKISEFLVLTFSNKAAHEMKTRIRDSLKKNGFLEASEEVEQADITTFDAYARKVVVKYSKYLGIDPHFNVLDETYLKTLKRDWLEQLINFHIEEDPKFEETMKRFCIKNDKHIIDLVMKVQAYADKSSDRKKAYKSLVMRANDKPFVDSCFNDFYQSVNNRIKSAIEIASKYPDAELADLDTATMNNFLDLGNTDAILNLIALSKVDKTLQFVNLKSHKTDEITKSIRGIVKAEFGKAMSAVSFYGDTNKERARLLEVSTDIESIVSLSKSLDKSLHLFKAETSSWTFADIFAMACEVVKDERIREEIKSQYKFIMVDEYQDTNRLQEDFISAISNDNVFAVGDIKQSIYRFRNAEPSIFQGKFERYEKGDGGTLIKLQDNFRSRKEVVDDINSIFSGCMSPSLGNVDYSNGHCFNWGNKDKYQATCDPRHNCETLSYFDADEHSKYTAQEKEAMVIANDIISKVENHYQVVDGKGNLKDCTPNDFAILISRKTNFSTYKRIFAEAKIPLAISDDIDLSRDDVSMAFRSLISLVQALDEDPKTSEPIERFTYASLMRSYVFAKTDKEIFESLQSGAYKASPLFETIRENKKRLLAMTVKDATIELLHLFPFVDNLKTIGNIKDNYEVLRSLVNIAESIDSVGLGFADFSKYFEDLDEYDIPMKVKSSGDRGGGVQLMSVHASKGLQFPIIYCPDLAKVANKDEAKGVFVMNDLYGLALPKTKSSEEPKSILHYLIAEQEAVEANDEYLRLFYVGLTRAEEKIILVCKKQDDCRYEPLNSTTLLKYSTKKNKNGEEETSISSVKCDSFEKYMALANRNIKTTEVEVKEPGELKTGAVVVNDLPAPEFRRVKVESVVKDRKKASKTTIEPIDDGALAYGTRLHRLLEIADFKTKDTSFIHSEKEKSVIDKVLSLSVFDDVSNAKVYHEYSFFDVENNIHGSIDLLLVYKDYCYVIDYKTKNIDDPSYEKQLEVYKSYIERKFHLPVKTGLLSIIGGTFKSVE